MVDIETVWNQLDSLLRKEEPEEDQYNHYLCPCGAKKHFFSGENPVCIECGRVDSYFLSEEAEWTSGIDADGHVSDPSRCGGPVDTGFYSPLWNMGTIISTRGNTYQTKKMSRIHFHMSMNHKDRALFHAYKQIELIGREKLRCSEAILDAAKLMYKEFTEKKLCRGDVRSGVKANCLFVACKKFGCPRTTKEIAEAFDINTKDIGRTSNILKDTVEEKVSASITKPKDVVNRIFNEFDIEEAVKNKMKRQVIKFCEGIERKTELMGKTPSGIASACIFVVLEGKISKNEICKAANVSLPTLNKIEVIIKSFT